MSSSSRSRRPRASSGGWFGLSERLGAGTRASLPRECTPSQRRLA